MTSQVYIEEYQTVSQWHGGLIQLPAQPLTTQILNADTSSVQSAAFNSATRFIKLTARSTAVNYLLGSNPTATTSTGRHAPAGVPIYMEVTPSQKIAVIQN